MARPKKISENDVGQFIKAYGRKSQPGQEPNDRDYSRRIEQAIKRLPPEQLDQLLHGELEVVDNPPPTP